VEQVLRPALRSAWRGRYPHGNVLGVAPSALWLFAHRALSPALQEDPRRFVQTLDTGNAPAFLEHLWKWARSNGDGPEKPPLTYSLDAIANGTIIRFRFRDVTLTGEPWSIRILVKDADPARPPEYARMFLLEHSEYATEQAGKPSAIVCESAKDGVHRNWGVVLAPDDEAGFDDAVFAVLRRTTPGVPPPS
jgi:hypothetical protein